MKKFLAITLSLIFVLTMASVSFADNGSITDPDSMKEWSVGIGFGWPSGNAWSYTNFAAPGYMMMNDKIAEGNVTITLDGAATSAEAGDWRGAATAEFGFYFKADIDPVRDGDSITGATVNSAYLLTLHNEYHTLNLISVAAGVETVVDTVDLDGLVEGLVDAETVTNQFDINHVGHVTLKADFTVDGKVAIYAGAGDVASTKVIDYTPDTNATVPAGNDVVLTGRGVGQWVTATQAPACFDAYSAEGVAGIAYGVDLDGSVDIDVNAKYVEGDKHDTYKVDISWGAMQFNFVAGQEWNADTHAWETNAAGGKWEVDGTSGEDNLITVTNHSSKAVSVALSYAEANESGVTAGEFSKESFNLDAVVEGGEATTDSATFMPTGTLVETEDNVDDNYVVIGKITVTIGDVVAGA